jgi:phosphatidylglycerophosphate synthase
VLTSVLAPLEKRVLIAMARRLPACINSDHLTALALLAMVGAGASYWLARWTPIGLLLSVIFLFVNWFGDSLDGTLARVRRQERPRYGYYVDHVLDAIGFIWLIAGLVLGGFMSLPIALVFLGAYYLLVIEVSLAVHALGRFTMSFWRVGPTELRIVLAAGAVALLHASSVRIGGWTMQLFDLGGIVGATGLMFTFLVSAVKNGKTLYREERL